LTYDRRLAGNRWQITLPSAPNVTYEAIASAHDIH